MHLYLTPYTSSFYCTLTPESAKSMISADFKYGITFYPISYPHFRDCHPQENRVGRHAADPIALFLMIRSTDGIY